MPIKIENRVISIETKNTLYQMKIDGTGILRHLWYGKKTDVNMIYLQDYHNIGFSGNPYDVGENRTYSTDTFPQEYSTFGCGDYRINALSVVNPDGTQAIDLRYVEHIILKGKYNIPGLPAVYADEDEAETLEIKLSDINTNVEVILKYGIIEKWDIITRSAVIINCNDKAVKIRNASSLCLDLPYGEWDWMHFHGRHSAERRTERSPIIHGIQESSSVRGVSSHHQNPSVVICSKDCTEDYGSCIGAVLMYSGSFKTKIELDQMNMTRLVMGINNENFEWILENGEEFYTPEAILSYSGEGLSKLSHNFHKIIRNNVCRGKYKLTERPVLINNWEATYFDFNSDKLYDIAKTASQLGIDMLVMDDGWFGNRESDTSGLGDWTVNENKLQGSLSELTSRITSLGMKFGIWFEPEMISEDSALYRTHPEWTIKIPGRNPVRSRCQLVLDMTRKDVREYLYRSISNILNSADISYVKWDMNRSICNLFSAEIPPERMGEMQHRYVLGLYELLERLTTDFPDVLFEGCSGGGGRFDAGMLYYCPQIWCSDNTDAYERTIIQYGTSFFYPVSTVGSHVSAVPNHQTGRITPLETRAVVAMAGSFGYELDLNSLTENEREEVKEHVKEFKENRNLIHNGDYYRLSNPLNDEYAAWEFAAEDNSQVLVYGVVFRSKPNSLRFLIKLKGLIGDAHYVLENDEKIYTGNALMEGGILIPRTSGDYCAFRFHFTKIDK